MGQTAQASPLIPLSGWNHRARLERVSVEHQRCPMMKRRQTEGAAVVTIVQL